MLEKSDRKDNSMTEKTMQAALDFTIDDLYGQAVSLSDHRYKNNVVLVFNRGFT
jgi:peroxiredoxin